MGIDQIPFENINWTYLPVYKLVTFITCFLLIASNVFTDKIIVSFLLSIAISCTLAKIDTHLNILKFEQEESFFSGKLPGLFSKPQNKNRVHASVNADANENADETGDETAHEDVHIDDDDVQYNNSEPSIQSNVFNEKSLETEVRTWDNGYGPQGLGEVNVSNVSQLAN